MQTGHDSRHRHRDGGFTLIELMVVVMILAILIALGLPSYQGFRRSSWDSAAKASLHSAEKVATLVLLEDGQFPGTAQLLIRLPAEEPNITWLNHLVSSTGPHEVSIDEHAGGTELAMAARSVSGRCYYQRLEKDGTTVLHHVDGAGDCEAHDFQNGAGVGW